MSRQLSLPPDDPRDCISFRLIVVDRLATVHSKGRTGAQPLGNPQDPLAHTRYPWNNKPKSPSIGEWSVAD